MCTYGAPVCMCIHTYKSEGIHTYIHTLCMYTYTLFTHTHTRKWRNEKQYLKNGTSLTWAVREGRKWNIIIILPESGDITDCGPDVNTRTVLDPAGVREFAIKGDEHFALHRFLNVLVKNIQFNLPPHLEHLPKSLAPSITLTIRGHETSI